MTLPGDSLFLCHNENALRIKIEAVSCLAVSLPKCLTSSDEPEC